MKLAIAAILLAAPVAAQTLTAENCEFYSPAGSNLPPSFVACQITNNGVDAVAAFSFAVSLTQPDRAVPWVDADEGRSRVAGGIEPGETVRTMFMTRGVPARADPSVIEISVTPYDAKNVAGELIAP